MDTAEATTDTTTIQNEIEQLQEAIKLTTDDSEKQFYLDTIAKLQGEVKVKREPVIAPPFINGTGKSYSVSTQPEVVAEAVAEVQEPETNEDVVDEEIVSEEAPVEISPEENKKNFSGNNFYKLHPEKVLGVEVQDKDRFGKEYKAVTGTIDNLEAVNLDYSFMNESNPYVTTVTKTSDEKASEPSKQGFVQKIIGKSQKNFAEKSISRKRKKADTDTTAPIYDLITFEETYDKYNQHLSLDELLAFIWHKETKEGDNHKLGVKWYELAKKKLGLENETITVSGKSNKEIRLHLTYVTGGYDNSNYCGFALEFGSGVLYNIGSYSFITYDIVKAREFILKELWAKVDGIEHSIDSFEIIFGEEFKEALESEAYNVDKWIKSGLVCYFDGKLIPLYLYLSGEMYNKYSRLVNVEDKATSGQDKKYILANYGQEVYDRQLSALDIKYKEVYEKRLLIRPSGGEESALSLSPVSDFCKKFLIKTLVDEEPIKVNKLDKDGKIDFLNTSYVREWQKKEVGDMSLIDAFQYWLTTDTNIIFKKGITYVEIIKWAIKQQNAPAIPKDADAAYRKMMKANHDRLVAKSMDEANRLFNIFLNEQLTMNDKVNIEQQWNSRFNGHIPVDYNKIPMAFSTARTYRNDPVVIKPAILEGVRFLFTTGAGCVAYDVGLGKGHLLTSNIVTPTGYRKMGNIKVGDEVIGRNGKPTKVAEIFPLGKVQCYKITFSDGSFTEVSDEHLWNVQTINYRAKYKDKWDTVVTKDIIDKLYNYRGDYQYSIPMVSPVEFEGKELPLHPYLLGLLLADGGLSRDEVTLSNPEIDVLEKVKSLLPESVELTGGDNGKDWRIARKAISGKNEVLDILRELGLIGTYSNSKFIPEIYKINSSENRLELLRGLIDGDGYVGESTQGKKGCCLQYTTVSKRLCDDVEFLIQSFGGTTVVNDKIPTYTHDGESKTGQLAYTITIRMPEQIVPVSSEKQLSKFVAKTKYQPIRFIQAIEDIGFQEAQCIRVEAEDHLYVCENFIVTHNTWVAIFAIRQFLDAGYCKRPLIVVPNQVYRQFVSEIKGLIPDVQINELYNMSADYIDTLRDENLIIQKVAEGSITIMTYEGFENISFNEDTQKKMMKQLFEILNQGGEDEKPKSKKDKTSFMEKLEALVGKGLKGGRVNIEDLGIDYINYDEAHAMKKSFVSVKGESHDTEEGKHSRGKTQYKLQSGSPSATGLKGFMISQYILANNKNRNIVLLTATPFTNSPLEVFSMLALVAYNELLKTDLNSITAFFDNYISVSTELTINAKLKPQYRQVVKGFKNIAALQELILTYFNHKDADNVPEIVRPNKIIIPYLTKIENGVTVRLKDDEKVESYISMTREQNLFMDQIRKYAMAEINDKQLEAECLQITGATASGEDFEVVQDENPDAIKDNDAQEVDEATMSDKEKAGVKLLRSVNFARMLAISPYLFKYSGLRNPTPESFIGSSPKLQYTMECIRSVKLYHAEHSEPMSGIVIYMDRGIEYFELIRKYLINNLGFDNHEVGVISSEMKGSGGTKEDAKENAKNLFLGLEYDKETKMFVPIPDSKRMKVLIGSSSIKEGMNLQRKATCLFDLTLDWNPTDFLQLSGRIHRQQNEFKNVRIVLPLMINSMDIFMFQKLEEKTARINTIWKVEGKASMLKLDDVNPQEQKYALIDDPAVLAEMQVEDEKAKIEDDIAEAGSIKSKLETLKSNAGILSMHKDDLYKIVEEYRNIPEGKEVSISKLLQLFKNIENTKKDKQGKLMLTSYEIQYEREKYKKEIEKGLSHKEEPDKPYWFDELQKANRFFERDNRDFLKPRGWDISNIDAYIKDQDIKAEYLKKQLEKIGSKEQMALRTEHIIEEKKKNKVRYKTFEQTIDDFKKLNYLLSIKYPSAQIQKADLEEYGCVLYSNDDTKERRIDAEAIEFLEKCVDTVPQTKDKHFENGDYTDERKKLHEEIYEKLNTRKHCISQEAPIAILTGGSPASGKTTFLKKYAPYLVSDFIYKIDADEVRAMLPEYRGWNATSTHSETQDIVKNFLLTENNIGVPCKYDLIYDGTMNKSANYKPLIGLLKRLGYKVFIIYMDNLSFAEAKKRSLKRYQKTGRYVPIDVLKDFYMRGKDALNELKTIVDGYMVVDAATYDYNILERGGMELPKDRFYAGMENGEFAALPEHKEPEAIEEPVKRKFVKREVAPVPAEPVIVPVSIEKRIAALEMSVKFLKDKAQLELTKKRINALKISMKFVKKETFGGGGSIEDNYTIWHTEEGWFTVTKKGNETISPSRFGKEDWGSKEELIADLKTLPEPSETRAEKNPYKKSNIPVSTENIHRGEPIKDWSSIEAGMVAYEKADVTARNSRINENVMSVTPDTITITDEYVKEKTLPRSKFEQEYVVYDKVQEFGGGGGIESGTKDWRGIVMVNREGFDNLGRRNVKLIIQTENFNFHTFYINEFPKNGSFTITGETGVKVGETKTSEKEALDYIYDLYHINERVYKGGGGIDVIAKEKDIDFMGKRFFVKYNIDKDENVEILSVSENGKELDYGSFGENLKGIIESEIKEEFGGDSSSEEMEKFIDGLQKKSQIMVVYPATYEPLANEFNNEIISELDEDAMDQQKFDELLNQKVDGLTTATLMSLVQDQIIEEFN